MGNDEVRYSKVYEQEQFNKTLKQLSLRPYDTMNIYERDIKL